VAALHLERVAGGVQLARRDTTAPLPLPSWPCEPGGAPQAIWLLPVGPGQGAAAKRAAWQRLAEAERALLLGLLALLAQGTPAGLSPEWTQGAQGWLRDARQHAEPPAWKRLARALRTRALGT
jgi:hypothetical protein